MSRRDAELRVFEAQKCFRAFNVGEHCWVHPATLKAMAQAEAALADSENSRALHLAAVVLTMMRRDIAKFQADPQAWIAKRREEMAA